MKKKFFKLLLTSILFLGSGVVACSASYDRGPLVPLPDRPDKPSGGDDDPTGDDDPSGDPTHDDDPPTTVQVDVIFDNNDGTNKKNTVKVNKGTPVAKPATDPTRDGYVFAGWCTDKAGTNPWDFSKDIKNKRTLYAGWTKLYKVTFNSGSGSPTVVEVPDGSKIDSTKVPSDPTQSGKAFTGWATNASKGFYFDFNSRIIDDITLTATWGAPGAEKINGYVFEAEYCPSLRTMQGATYSGGAFGSGLIHNDFKEDRYSEASNGYYVQFIYVKDNTLVFKINSDKEVNDANIYMRLAGEYHIPGFSICADPSDPRCVTTAGSDDNLPTTKGALYTIKINGERVTNYNNDGFITFDVPTALANNKFQDYVLKLNCHLNAGENTIEMITDNAVYHYGTAVATAPMIDCISIYTSAQLTFANADYDMVKER